MVDKLGLNVLTLQCTTILIIIIVLIAVLLMQSPQILQQIEVHVHDAKDNALNVLLLIFVLYVYQGITSTVFLAFSAK